MHCFIFSIIFTLNVEIGNYFVYFHWCLKKDVIHVKFSNCTQQFNVSNSIELINEKSLAN